MCDTLNSCLLGDTNPDDDTNVEHADDKEELIDIFNIPLFYTCYLRASKDPNEKKIVYKQRYCCGCKMRKRREELGEEKIKYYRDSLEASLNYAMYEDVHQVANFTEIELNKEIALQNKKDQSGFNQGGSIRLKKRYSG